MLNKIQLNKRKFHRGEKSSQPSSGLLCIHIRTNLSYVRLNSSVQIIRDHRAVGNYRVLKMRHHSDSFWTNKNAKGSTPGGSPGAARLASWKATKLISSTTATSTSQLSTE
eukprot:gene33103-42818_t